jgi:hypothetical protein
MHFSGTRLPTTESVLRSWYYGVGTTKLVLRSWYYRVSTTELVLWSRYRYYGVGTGTTEGYRYYGVATKESVLRSWYYGVGTTELVLRSHYYGVGTTESISIRSLNRLSSYLYLPLSFMQIDGSDKENVCAWNPKVWHKEGKQVSTTAVCCRCMMY